MTSISSQNQSKIQTVDNQIQEFIQQAKAGQQPDAKEIDALVQQLTALQQNKEIPEGVRQNLQIALNELKQMSGGKGGIDNLFSVKMQLDSLLSEGEGQPIELASEEEGSGKSEL
jgi:predicted dinucleotide-utilizing enzyme